MAGTVAAEVTSASGVMAASSLFYFLLIPAITLWFVYWKLSRRHMLQLAETLPGPDGLPIIGNLMDLVGSSHCKWFYFNHSFFSCILLSKSKFYSKIRVVYI